VSDRLAPSKRHAAALEVRRLRGEAQVRYSEVDLLVAALRDHVRDLQAERDVLRAQLARAAEERRLEASAWMWRGMKQPANNSTS
jgi:hypothetical protein